MSPTTPGAAVPMRLAQLNRDARPDEARAEVEPVGKDQHGAASRAAGLLAESA